MEQAYELGDFSCLLSALFGSLLDKEPWEEFLRVLAKLVDANFAVLILSARGAVTPGSMHTPGGDPRRMEDYAQNFCTLDPFVGLPEGQVTAFSEFVRGPVRESSFWRDYLEAAGGDQILGVDLRFESGLDAHLRVTRDSSRVDFGRAERERFQMIVPHVRRALELFERLQASHVEHGVYYGVVERMGIAAIILDIDGKVLRTNAVADRLLAASDGIAICNGKLGFSQNGQRKTLQCLLRSLSAACDPVSLPAQRFRIQRPSGRRDLSVVAKAVSAPTFIRSGGGAAIALLVSDCEDEVDLHLEAIRDIFQLTRMQAMLAAVLANGCSLVDAAAKLGIAHNTARAHLRSIFIKMGVRRQSQLVHLLHASMPELSALADS
jgi:DNA-binding CsgD family transcriptional regulator